VLDKAGMDFKTCASIHDDFLLRKELEKAGVCIPGDRLNIILELRKAQTQTTEIRTDDNYSGGVSEMSTLLPSLPEGSVTFKKWESVLDKTGMDFKTCASIHDDFLLRKEFEKAGVCIPGDRLNIILELRKAQTQTTEIRTDDNYSGGVSEMSTLLQTIEQTMIVSPTIVQTRNTIAGP
jgi:hypothetical protein